MQLMQNYDKAAAIFKIKDRRFLNGSQMIALTDASKHI